MTADAGTFWLDPTILLKEAAAASCALVAMGAAEFPDVPAAKKMCSADPEEAPLAFAADGLAFLLLTTWGGPPEEPVGGFAVP